MINLSMAAAIPTPAIMTEMNNAKGRGQYKIVEIVNELKPVDIYCYLYARFGAPNGLQNLFLAEDSDNLIHWEWAISIRENVILVQGHNFRSEVHIMGDLSTLPNLKFELITSIKEDFKKYGKDMTQIRTLLEEWQQFLNPYNRIRASTDEILKQIKELNLDPTKDKIADVFEGDDVNANVRRVNELGKKYAFAVGLGFGVRAMLPVLGESFVNFLIFILAKKEVKSDSRFFLSIVRQQIDVRIKSLHLNCDGFKNPIDYKAPACAAFHTLINERNNLLHGNVNIEDLKFNDVYFNGRVPIFRTYEDQWERSIGVSLRSIRFESLEKDREAVRTFILYVIDQLEGGGEESN